MPAGELLAKLHKDLTIEQIYDPDNSGHIKPIEPKYTIFANQLLPLAPDFEDRKIMQLI